MIRHFWNTLNFLQNIHGRRISLFILAVIPPLVSIEAQLNSNNNNISLAFISGLLNILEMDNATLPLNLMRTFWAATLYLASALIFTIWYPVKLKSLSDYEKSFNAEKLKKSIKTRNPSIVDVELKSEVQKHWESATLDLLSSSTVALVLSAILFAGSTCLTFIVLEQNVIKINQICPIEQLFNWRIIKCSPHNSENK